MATAPCGAVALRCQAADPGIARKPGGGNLVGAAIIHGNPRNARKAESSRDASTADARRLRRRANVLQQTHSTLGFLGETDAPPMEDEAEAERSPLRRREVAAQFALDLFRILLHSECQFPAQSADVGVDRQSG